MESHNPASPGKCNSLKTLLIFHVLSVLIFFFFPFPFPLWRWLHAKMLMCNQFSSLPPDSVHWVQEASETVTPPPQRSQRSGDFHPSAAPSRNPKRTDKDKMEAKSLTALSLPAQPDPKPGTSTCCDRYGNTHEHEHPLWSPSSGGATATRRAGQCRGAT